MKAIVVQIKQNYTYSHDSTLCFTNCYSVKSNTCFSLFEENLVICKRILKIIKAQQF